MTLHNTMTPYLTCDKCNSLMFIDAANARNFGARMSRDTCKRRADDEVLGMCPSCASTANLQLGAHDFLDKIAGNKAELIQKIKIRHSAAFLEHPTKCWNRNSSRCFIFRRRLTQFASRALLPQPVEPVITSGNLTSPSIVSA